LNSDSTATDHRDNLLVLPHVLYRNVAVSGVHATTAETTVYSFSLVVGTLGTDKLLDCT
jgi:hypothetical protein